MATGKSPWLIVFSSGSITVCLTLFCQNDHFCWSSEEQCLRLQAPFSDMFSKRGKKVSGKTLVSKGCQARQTTPFLWLWWHAYVHAFERSAGNDETETNLFWQRAVNLWKTNLYITAEALTNIALWENLNTNIMQSANCLQRLHWQTFLGLTEVRFLPSGSLKQQLNSALTLVADMQLSPS